MKPIPKLPILLLAGCLALPLAVAAEDATITASQVLEMLEAGLSEEVVLEWLAGAEESTARPTPDELIALKKAGATDRLLKALLAGSRGERVEPAPEPLPAAPPAVASSPTEAPPVNTDRDPADTGVLVRFELSYEPPKVDYDEELWDLYVYLDGEPLAYVPPILSVLDRSEVLEFRQRLAPGRHVIRVTQERHERRGRNRWRHSARVSDQQFAFDVEPVRDGELELAFSEGFLGARSTGPLTFRFRQQDRVTEVEGVGGLPDRWAPLCEEIEAGFDGDTRSRAEARALEGCVRWASLWGDVQAPSRDAVRRALEKFDFRPVPRGS